MGIETARVGELWESLVTDHVQNFRSCGIGCPGVHAVVGQESLSEAHRRSLESTQPSQRIGDQRLPVPMPPYRRKGLLTLRETRITQVETLSLLKV